MSFQTEDGLCAEVLELDVQGTERARLLWAKSRTRRGRAEYDGSRSRAGYASRTVDNVDLDYRVVYRITDDDAMLPGFLNVSGICLIFAGRVFDSNATISITVYSSPMAAL